MNDKTNPAWGGSLISRRRMLQYSLTSIAGIAGGFWPASALGEITRMSGAKTGARAFDTLEYHTLDGSWRYSSIAIHKNYIGEYICYDNLYDMEKNPGHSSGKLPDALVSNIESHIDAFTIVSEQKIAPGSPNYYSYFTLIKDNKTQIQPEPDQEHEYMFPQYANIADAFMECIEYLQNNGDRFFLETQCAVDIDSKNHAVFTFQVHNTGTVHGKIRNFLEQSEYASTYHTKKGPGPLFTRSDCTIINANFDVKQAELDIPPSAPLVVKVRTNSAMPRGEWAFTLGLDTVQEIPADGGEARTYNFRTDLVTVTLN